MTNPTDLTKEERMRRALMVIILSPRTRAWLAENDPKALQQCREALDLDITITRMTHKVSDDFTAIFKP